MKTNKLVKILALSAIFTSSVAMLAACGGDKHELTLIGEQAATCTTDGHKAYYMCTHCDSIFEDAAGKIETSLDAVKIEKYGHDLSKHEAEDATCTKPGNIEYYTCSREEGKYFTADGVELATVVTTKDHDWSDGGVHAYVQPTTDSEGSLAYWQCNDCHNIYADANGDKQTTLEELKLDRVKENLDGVLTEGFYNTENAYAVGNDGLGFVINGKKETDGIYLHIVANYNTPADSQTGDHGKIGLLFNFRNEDNLNLPGALGVCLDQTIYMELYLSNRIAYHDANTIKYFDTKTNTEEGKAKYTTTWELFLSYEDLSKANGGKLAEAFEEVSGKTVLKANYAPMLTAVGNMTYAEEDEFTEDDVSNCRDMGGWLMWYKEGYGDYDTEQKYMALGKDGFSEAIPRVSDTYTVTKNDVQNATVTLRDTTVAYNQSVSGQVTVDEGYVFSGIKVNGKVVVTKGTPTQENVYDYSFSVASLGLKWYETEIDLEFVVVKNEKQNITFTLQSVAGGKTTNVAENTVVVLENEFGDRYETRVGANGVVSIQDVLCQDYVIKVADYLDSGINVVKDGTIGTVKIVYHFAHNVGDRADLVDLTDMNAENASITLGEQGVNGVDKHTIAAQLNLSEEMKNAKAYVLYTTVTVNGEIQNGKGAWWQRFAIRFAEGDANNTYNNKFVVWWDDLGLNSNPSAIWASNATTCGGATERQATYDWLASDVLDGLQLKVVRNGGYVAISVYSLDDERWYTLLEGTTSETAKNDITFFASGESFTFSEISFEELVEIDRVLPQGSTAGKLEHLQASNGDIFHVNGTIATDASLVLKTASVNVTVNAFEKDGKTEVTLANGTKILLIGTWQTYTYTVGESFTEMLADKYEAYLYGYGKANFTVNEAGGNVVIDLTKVIAYSENGTHGGDSGVTVDNANNSITITGNGVVDDNATWAGSAELVLSEELSNSKNVVLTFTLKDTYSPQGGWDWTARRFGVTMQGTNGGFMCFTPTNAESAFFVMGATPAKEDGKVEFHDLASLLRSANGVKMQMVRLGDRIVVNAEVKGAWVRVGEFACNGGGATKIVFYGEGDTWQFSQISAGVLEHVNAVDPSEANNFEGNVEYYTDGTHYYLANGSVATLEEVSIKQVAVTLSATAKELDGATSVSLANGTAIALTGRYKNYTYTVGGSNNPTEMLAGTYEAYLYGYGKAEVVVPDNGGAVVIALVKTIAYGYRETVVDDGTGTIKITGSGCPADGTPWSGYAEIVTDQTNADKVFEFVVKDTHIRNGQWDNAARRIAIQVAGNNGFFFWFNSESEVCVRHLGANNIGAAGYALGTGSEVDPPISTNQGWMKTIVEDPNGEGLKFHILRNGTTIVLSAYNGTQWITIGETTCGAEDKTNFTFYAQGDDYVFSGIKVEDVTVTTVEAKAPTTMGGGNIAYYTDGTVYYTSDNKGVTLDELMLPKLLATPTYTFDGSEENAITNVNRGDEAAASADGIVFTTVASGDWADYEANPIKISVAQTFAKDKTVEINFNLKGANQVYWASDRFGIEIAGMNGLFVWNNENAGMVCGIVDETMKTETLKLGEFKWLGNAIASENGANFKLIRKGNVIRCYAQNGTEWVYLGTVACSADDDTQIAFIAKGATWTVSNLTVSEIEAEMQTEE